MRIRVAVRVAFGFAAFLIAEIPAQTQVTTSAKIEKPGAARPDDNEKPGTGAGQLAALLAKHPVIRPAGTFSCRLFLMEVATGKTTTIVDEPMQGYTHCGSPWWSHDGKRVLFDTTPMNLWQLSHLMAVELNDGPPKLTDLGMGNCPSMSADGKRIVFLSNEESHEAGVYVMDPDGANRTRLGSYGRPALAPDGRKLLIMSFASPCDVSLMDVETSKTRSIELPGHQIFSIASWADAGTLVAVVGPANARAGDAIALLDVTDPNTVKIKSVLWKKPNGLAMTLLVPVYHAASRRCLFVGIEKKGRMLYSFVAGDSPEPQPVEAGVYRRLIGNLTVSPDGRFVIFNSDEADAPSR